jgi:hypothetical protein
VANTHAKELQPLFHQSIAFGTDFRVFSFAFITAARYTHIVHQAWSFTSINREKQPDG